MNDILVKMFKFAYKIIDCYNLLVTFVMNDMKDSIQYVDTLNDLNLYLDEEIILYNSLNKDDIDKYIDITSSFLKNDIDKIDNNKNIIDILNRMINMLNEKKWLLDENSFLIDVNIKQLSINDTFLISDFIENYIIVETYKEVYKRIIYVDAFTSNDRKFKKNLSVLFNISKIRECSSFKLIELYTKKYNFDVERMPKLNLDILFDNNILNDEIYRDIYDRVVGLIDYLTEFDDNDNYLDDVFDALVSLCELKICLDILDNDNLLELFEYYNFEFDDINDSLVNNEVKRLIRKKEDDF